MPTKKTTNVNNQNFPVSEFKAIDFFCGGGGMTCGLRQAGINVIAGVDFDKHAKATYELNNPGSVFIHEDITKLPLAYFEESLRTFVSKIMSAHARKEF